MENEKKKKDKISMLVSIVLVGVLLLVVVMPFGKTKSDTSQTQSAEETAIQTANEAAYYEQRLKNILEHSYGSGTMDVMVHLAESFEESYLYGSKEQQAKVDGVLVVAQVKEPEAVSDITFAVCALFDLPAHKVAVMIKK
ncbi:MAG: hypothetical protein PUA62_07425 [Lachnospiraceae bacterium]|nr:hypothetical protein [Lachnospiraceae bacterium]